MFNRIFAPIALVCLGVVSPLMAQSPAADVNVQAKINKVTVASQKTPKIDASGVTDKRWRPRTWIEVEVEFETKVRKDAVSPFIDELDFKYYVVLNAIVPGSQNQRVVLTGEVGHTSIDSRGVANSVMYISPATLAKYLNKTDASERDIAGWAVEVFEGVNRVAVADSQNTKAGGTEWWTEMPSISGLLLNKTETPFSSLWGDFHADVKKK